MIGFPPKALICTFNADISDFSLSIKAWNDFARFVNSSASKVTASSSFLASQDFSGATMEKLVHWDISELCATLRTSKLTQP